MHGPYYTEKARGAYKRTSLWLSVRRAFSDGRLCWKYLICKEQERERERDNLTSEGRLDLQRAEEKSSNGSYPSEKEIGTSQNA